MRQHKIHPIEFVLLAIVVVLIAMLPKIAELNAQAHPQHISRLH